MKVWAVFDGQFIIRCWNIPNTALDAGPVKMNSSFQLHLSSSTNNSASDNSERRKKMVILDIGGERFLCDRDLLEAFPATRFVRMKINIVD